MMVSSLLSLCHAGGFAGSHAVGTEAVLDGLNRARRRRPWPLAKKRKMRTELAYSATSSSAETSFLGRRCALQQARQPEIV